MAKNTNTNSKNVKNTQPDFVHESETQRQHVRVEMPCRVSINEVLYKAHNISSGGFSVKANGKTFNENVKHNVTIIFPLNGADFRVNTTAKVTYVNKEMIGFTYVNLSGETASVIRKLIRSYLAGMMTTEGDILNVYQNSSMVPPRNSAPANDDSVSGWKRAIGVLMIAMLGILGLFLIGSNVYENTMVIKADAAYIDGEKITLRTVSDGLYNSLLSNKTGLVEAGQPIAMMQGSLQQAGFQNASTNENGQVIKSPCDCVILKSHARDGEFQALGDPIMELFPRDGKMWIIASIKSENAHRLDFYDDVRIRVAGESNYINGTVEEFMMPGSDMDSHRVRISIDETFPAQLLGKPAYVEFIL
jgi:alginate biosynthesis protein Alg44